MAAESAMIDGEAVAFRPDGHSDIEGLVHKGGLSAGLPCRIRSPNPSTVYSVGNGPKTRRRRAPEPRLTTKQREWHERFCRLLKNHELYRDEYAVKLARGLGEETGIRLESEVRKVFELAKAHGRTKPVPS